MTLVEVQVKWSVILMDRFGPDIFSTLQTKRTCFASCACAFKSSGFITRLECTSAYTGSSSGRGHCWLETRQFRSGCLPPPSPPKVVKCIQPPFWKSSRRRPWGWNCPFYDSTGRSPGPISSSATAARRGRRPANKKWVNRVEYLQ